MRNNLPPKEEIRSGLMCNDGLTIIEVLIALAILSIGVLSVAKLQVSTVKNTSRANVITQATMLAQAKIEELKGFKTMSALDGENGDVDPDITASAESGGPFTRTTEIDGMGTGVPELDNNIRRITVTVTWKSGWSGSNRVQLTSLTQGNGI